MPENQENVIEKRVIQPTEEMVNRWNEAGKLQKEGLERQGRGEDGTYIIVETDKTTGTQTVVCAPHDNNEIMRIPHPQIARNWIAEWGEAGFGYIIFKAIDGMNGTLTAEELQRKRADIQQAFQG